MPKTRPLREPPVKPAADGGVIVTLPPEPAEPEPVIYGKPKPAEAPPPPPPPRIPEPQFVEDDDPPEDPRESLRRTEDAAAERQKRQRAEQDAARALAWGQEQARKAAQAEAAISDSHLDTITTALAKAESDSEQALQDAAAATARGDFVGAERARKAMRDAERQIATLEAGKDELEANKRRGPPAPAVPPAIAQNVEAILNTLPNLTPEERDWIRAHPESLADARNQQVMSAAFRECELKGIPRGSKEYFRLFEDRLGYAAKAANGGEPEQDDMNDEPAPPAPRRVAAPVSRSAPGGERLRPGQVLLNEAQREAARISGVDEVTYARGLERMRDLKKQGVIQ